MCCYLALTLLLLSSAGCGTLGTMFDPQCGKWEPYSGVAASAGGHATQIDIPFSFGLDTACLPITIPKHFIERAHQGRKAGTPPAQSPAPTPTPNPLADSEPPR
jgi:uncharacterized protein YceK